MNIVYAADDNYSYLAGISMLSLLNNCKNPITIYILDDNISADNKEKLISIVEREEYKNKARLIFLDIKLAIEDITSKIKKGYGLNLDGHISFTAYSRLYLADIMLDVDKLIYLDCDTIIANDGLEELYNIELEDDKVMAAVADYTTQEYKEWLGISRKEKYYNSGVMIIDLEKWRCNNCSDIVFKYMGEHGEEGYPFADQDYINVCLRDRIQNIPLKYNIQTPNFMYPIYSSIKYAFNVNEMNYYGKKDYNESVKKPVVIHYSGMAFIRPWYKNSNHPEKLIWLKYLKQSPWKDIQLNNWPVNKYILIREWMYKFLPCTINGFLSGFFLRATMRKLYK